jgi:hypothetical protein
MRSLFLLAIGALTAAALPRFEPVQQDLLSAGGAFVNAFADHDGDGDLDQFVGFNGAPNRLYRNDRGQLTDVAAAAGVADARPTRAAAWGDYDADGDPDLLVGFAPLSAAAQSKATRAAGSVLRLYRNDRGRFVDVTAEAGLIIDKGAVRQSAWIDVDADGDLDLFVGFRDRADALFQSDRGRFADIAPRIGLADTRPTVGAVWFDFDRDGDLDLYAAHMDGDANGLYRHDRGTFTDIAEAAGVAWGGRTPREPTHGTVRPCAGDLDGDGTLDLFMANYGPNGLFLNRGGRFEDVSAAWGLAVDARYDSCAFSDFDHDGRLDVYVNGTITGGVSHPDTLYRNTGTALVDATPEIVAAQKADHGVAWADVDRDGDEDLSLTGSASDGMHLLLRNMLPKRDAERSLHIRVVDGNGRATRAGAEIRVYAAGTRRLLATRLVDSGSGYNMQNDMPTHVGLARRERVNVEVTFPAAGRALVARQSNVDPSRFRGKALEIRVK